MDEPRSVGLTVLAVVVLLSLGTAGVAVGADTADASVSPAPLQVDDSEITVDDEEPDDEPRDDDPGDSFDVNELDGPDEVAVGETVTVTATVSNPNEFETTQPVEFRLDGDVVDRSTVTIDAESERTVSIELDTGALGVGSYIHGFLTTDRGEQAVLDVLPVAEIEIDAEETDDESVVVERVQLSEGGFVVITDDEGSVIGVSRYLDAGSYQDIEIELTNEVTVETTLTAVTVLDANDDETFDADEDDQPYTEVDGEPVTDSDPVPAEDDDRDGADEGDEDDTNESNESDDDDSAVDGANGSNETNVTDGAGENAGDEPDADTESEPETDESTDEDGTDEEEPEPGDGEPEEAESDESDASTDDSDESEPEDNADGENDADEEDESDEQDDTDDEDGSDEDEESDAENADEEADSDEEDGDDEE